MKVYIPEKRVNTNIVKVGCFIGDFVKTSIGTLINTGGSIGIGSMVIHSGMITPSHIPPFTWFIKNEIIDPGNFEAFLKSCETITSRRGITFSENYKNLLTNLYNLTNDLKEREISKWRRMQK